MIDLAMQHGTGPVTLAEISQRQKISLSYLEQLFAKLRRRMLVDSVRGPGGGYTLAKDMAQVSVADIILAVDEPIDATQCGGKENCRDDQKCITHDLWAKLNDHILDYLRGVTLKQLVDGQKAKASGVAQVQDMRETLAKRDRTPVSA
jgi:Rrf2 family iron-sulfur cluster assembly transcriptional regulator